MRDPWKQNQCGSVWGPAVWLSLGATYSKHLIACALLQIVTSASTDLQDYTYYFVPAPWLSVKLLRLLQCYPPPGNGRATQTPPRGPPQPLRVIASAAIIKSPSLALFWFCEPFCDATGKLGVSRVARGEPPVPAQLGTSSAFI